MQPDERLDQQLSAAGDRARSASRPDAEFTVSLREHLMAGYPAPVAGAPSPPSQPRGRFGLPRPMRAAPLALAAVLAVATVVGARELYVAFVAEPSPTPSVSPVPTAEPTPSATEQPTPEPTERPTPEPTPSVTELPTPEPTQLPTLVPTPVPTAKPTSPPVAGLALDAVGCDGGVLLEWSPYAGSGFDHYLLLRGASAASDGKALDGSWLPYAEKTTGFDASGKAGETHWYRAAAYDAAGKLIGRSPAVAAKARPVAALGPLQVASVEGATKVKWSPYGGASACFTYYKVAYSLENPKPSYLAGDPAVAVSGQGSDRVILGELTAGKTYYLRVQVIRSTHMGSFLVAQSEVAQHTVP